MKQLKPLLLFAALAAHMVGAIASPKGTTVSKAPAGPVYQFCIMEGVGKQQSQADAEALWEPLQKTVSKAIGERALFHLYQSFALIERDLKEGACDIALIKPVHYAGMAMKSHGYEPVVRIGGAYVGNFVVHRDSPIKDYAGLAGKTIMLPDEKSLQSLLAKKYFKENPLNPPPILKHTRLQETVLYAVETQTVDAGWVNPTLAAQWVDKGSNWMTGAIREAVISNLEKNNDTRRLEELKAEASMKQKILHRTEPYPYWVIVASKRVNGRGEAIRQALLQFAQDPANKTALESMGIKKGFLEVDAKTRSFYESLI